MSRLPVFDAGAIAVAVLRSEEYVGGEHEALLPDPRFGRRIGGEAGRVAAQHVFVVVLRKSNHLQPGVELIGPEPGNLRICQFLATQCRCGRLGLLHRVVHRLESQAARQKGIGMIGAVSGSNDARVFGSGELVDPNSILASQSGFASQLDFITIGSENGISYGVQGMGSGGMPAFGQMYTEDQLEAVVDYERNLP